MILKKQKVGRAYGITETHASNLAEALVFHKSLYICIIIHNGYLGSKTVLWELDSILIFRHIKPLLYERQKNFFFF